MDNNIAVTKEQIAQIVTLLASDCVPYAAAKEFIERFSPAKPERALTVYRSSAVEPAALPPDELVGIWESAFPGRGIRVAAMLQAFVAWKPKLAPPISGLMKKARKAVAPWGTVEGIRLNRQCSFWERRVMDYATWSNPPSDTIAQLWDNHRSLLNDLLDQTRPDSEATPGRREFSNRLDQSLDRIWLELETEVRAKLGCPKNSPLTNMVYRAFRSCIYQACGFELLGRSEEAAKYIPLLELWLAGNFPLDHLCSRLYLLVAP